MIQIDLTGKVALVTGAGQGLGEATARMLHQAGATLALNDLADAGSDRSARLDQLAADLADRASCFTADVRDLPAIEQMVGQLIEELGGLDIVVNNAGIIRDRTIKNMETAEWQDVIDTNLTGVYHVCRVVAGQIRPGGRIINLSSISAFLGTFGQANYVAAKAGVAGLTRVLSRELARDQVTVNAIAPGLIMTEMSSSIPEEHREAMLTQIPLGRHGEPEDIAGVVLFLASDLASYVSGQTLHVNGGWYA
jgi:3-oxoacyl-[acyl-carrier protein] reductase